MFNYSYGSFTEQQSLGIIAILIGLFNADKDGRDEISFTNVDASNLERWGWK